MKKLPGKKKPPTLTLKEADPASGATPVEVPKNAAPKKLPGRNKQTDITLKRG